MPTDQLPNIKIQQPVTPTKTFVYQLKDESGKSLYGFGGAKDLKDLKRRLRQSEFYFISAKQTDVKEIYNISADHETLLMLTRRLYSLIESGVPILTAMNILWRQTEDKNIQLVISHIRQKLEGGNTISSAMEDFPRVFPPIYRSMIQVSERAGGLVYVLRKLTDYLEYQKQIIMRTKKATLYPLIVLVFAILVLISMFAFVVPIFQKVLINLNVKLPLITQIVINISAFIRSWFFIITLAVLIGGGYFIYRKLRKHKDFSYKVDSLKLKLPIMGHIFYLTAIGRFVHSMSVLVASGLPIVQSLDMSKSTVGNEKIAVGIVDVRREVEQGNALYGSFKSTKIFPVLMVEMIGVGESAGSLVNVLENLTKHFDEEVEYHLNKVLTMIEPALIIFVGTIVIFTLLAIYTPIFSIWKGLTG